MSREKSGTFKRILRVTFWPTFFFQYPGAVDVGPSFDHLLVTDSGFLESRQSGGPQFRELADGGLVFGGANLQHDLRHEPHSRFLELTFANDFDVAIHGPAFLPSGGLF